MKANGFGKILFALLAILMVTATGYLHGPTSVLAEVNNNEGQDDGVGLHSRKLIAPPDRNQALKALKEIPPGHRQYMIIQLDGIPNATERGTLAESGIKLKHYIHNQSWYALVSGGLDATLPLMERVRGSWSIKPSDRLAPMLQQGKIPDHAVTEHVNENETLL
jgi:hypothetical protein